MITVYEQNLVYLIIVLLSVCCGILLIGTMMFISIFFKSRSRLHLSTILNGVLGLLFVGFEIALIHLGMNGDTTTGLQFHRIQGLTAGAFLFSIPFLMSAIFQLTPRWRFINLGISYLGAVAAVALIIIAFVSPDSFISQTVLRPSPLSQSWHAVRGMGGWAYLAMQMMIFIIVIYILVCIITEIAVTRVYGYMVIYLAGILAVILFGLLDVTSAIYESQGSVESRRFFSWFSFGITAFIAVSMITVIRQFIDQTRDIDKAMKIDSLGIFAGGIAHDFNNFLTIIVGNLSLVLLKTGHDDETRRVITEAEEAAFRARDLTQQLLTFSRGGAPLRRVTTVSDILKDTAHFILSGSEIGIVFNIDDDLKNIRADKAQISQVVQNLIINAMQAMPGGGTITITARNYAAMPRGFAPGPPREYVQIVVSDTGPGIHPRHRERIFDPYFTTKMTGNGLGLSICYSIIKNHDGHIHVLSRPGEGAIFEMLLPATNEAPAAVPEQIDDEITPGGRILLMDDDDMILEVGERMLRRLGFETDRAHHGVEAIERYTAALERGTPYRCIIMDLTIPGGMGGREAVAILRERDPRLKAIVSSGYSNDEVMAAYREHGFDGVIAKPYRFEEMKTVVFRVLSTERVGRV